MTNIYMGFFIDGHFFKLIKYCILCRILRQLSIIINFLLNYVVLRALWKIDVHLISTLVNKSLYYYYFYKNELRNVEKRAFEMTMSVRFFISSDLLKAHNFWHIAARAILEYSLVLYIYIRIGYLTLNTMIVM